MLPDYLQSVVNKYRKKHGNFIDDLPDDTLVYGVLQYLQNPILGVSRRFNKLEKEANELRIQNTDCSDIIKDAKEGNWNKVRFCIKYGNVILDKPTLLAHYASEEGHTDILKYAVNKGANNWNWIAGNASFRGHMDILKYAVNKCANNWNWIAGNASFRGHMDILEYAISKGADDWDDITRAAKDGGNMYIINWIEKNRY